MWLPYIRVIKKLCLMFIFVEESMNITISFTTPNYIYIIHWLLSFILHFSCKVSEQIKTWRTFLLDGSKYFSFNWPSDAQVSFVGEPGLDMGGLTKEWFQLLIKQIFDSEYGMFVYHTHSRYFHPPPHTPLFLLPLLPLFPIHLSLPILPLSLPPDYAMFL